MDWMAPFPTSCLKGGAPSFTSLRRKGRGNLPVGSPWMAGRILHRENTEGLKTHVKHEETEMGSQHTSNASDPTKFPDLIWWNSSKNITKEADQTDER